METIYCGAWLDWQKDNFFEFFDLGSLLFNLFGNKSDEIITTIIKLMCFVLQKEIAALKELCYRANIKKEEIEACCPKRKYNFKSANQIRRHTFSVIVHNCFVVCFADTKISGLVGYFRRLVGFFRLAENAVVDFSIKNRRIWVGFDAKHVPFSLKSNTCL